MDDIGVTNDDASAVFSLRRPSRAERAVDDPIREMEGMLVDEYGRYELLLCSTYFNSSSYTTMRAVEHSPQVSVYCFCCIALK